MDEFMAISIKTSEDIEKMRVAGVTAAKVLEMIEPYIKPRASPPGELGRIITITSLTNNTRDLRLPRLPRLSEIRLLSINEIDCATAFRMTLNI